MARDYVNLRLRPESIDVHFDACGVDVEIRIFQGSIIGLLDQEAMVAECDDEVLIDELLDRGYKIAD